MGVRADRAHLPGRGVEGVTAHGASKCCLAGDLADHDHLPAHRHEIQETGHDTCREAVALRLDALQLGLEHSALLRDRLGAAAGEVVEGDRHRHTTGAFLHRADAKRAIGMLLLQLPENQRQREQVGRRQAARVVQPDQRLLGEQALELALAGCVPIQGAAQAQHEDGADVDQQALGRGRLPAHPRAPPSRPPSA